MNNVDFPTLGSPTIPHLSAILSSFFFLFIIRAQIYANFFFFFNLFLFFKRHFSLFLPLSRISITLLQHEKIGAVLIDDPCMSAGVWKGFDIGDVLECGEFL